MEVVVQDPVEDFHEEVPEECLDVVPPDIVAAVHIDNKGLVRCHVHQQWLLPHQDNLSKIQVKEQCEVQV